GGLTVQGTSRFILSGNGSLLTIKGNLSITSTGLTCDSSGEAIVEVEGNITQTGTAVDNCNFGLNSTFVLKGSTQQTISFQNPAQCAFGVLLNKNTSQNPLIFTSALNFDKYINNGFGITGSADKTSPVKVSQKVIFFRYQGEGGWMNKELNIYGGLDVIPNPADPNTSYDAFITETENDSVTLKINGNFRQSGGYFKTYGQKMIVTGDFTQTGGTFELMGNKSQVEVNNMSISGDAVYKMKYEGSRVIVNNNFTINTTAQSTTDNDKKINENIAAGTMEIKGNFTQMCSPAPTNNTSLTWPDSISPRQALDFCAVKYPTEIANEDLIPQHRVILNGTGTQTIQFQSASKINSSGALTLRLSQFSILTLMQPRNKYIFKNDLSKERIYEKLEDLSINTNKGSDLPYILKANMSIPRTHFGMAVADGSIFAIGGTNNTTVFNDIDVYNPQTDNWGDYGNMAETRKDFAVASIGSNVYVFGGTRQDGTISATGETFSATSSTVNYLKNSAGTANLTFAARKEHKAVSYKGKVYIMGGSNSSGTILNTVEIYDPSAKAIVSPAPSPMVTARKNFAATNAVLKIGGVEKNVIVAAGGETTSGITGSVEYLDPDTNTWNTLTGALKTPRKGFGLEFVCGKLYAFGGLNSSNAYLNTVEIYDETTQTWNLSDRNISMGRAFFGEVAAFNSVFIGGGENPTVLDRFEQYLPSAITSVRLKGSKKSVNGDYTEDETDLSFTSSVTDFGLSRTYNTQFKDDKNDLLGYGWKFNLQSSIKEISGSVGEVTASLLYIRDNPYGNILGCADKGTVVSYNPSGTKKDVNGKDWYQITIGSKTCYVASWYIKTVSGRTVEVEYPNGIKGYFTCPASGSGYCTRSFGIYDSLYCDTKGTTSITDDEFTLTTKDQTKYAYKILYTGDISRNYSITDKFGNKTTLTYTMTGTSPNIVVNKIVANVVNTSRSITIQRDSVDANKIVATDNTSRTVTYMLANNKLKYVYAKSISGADLLTTEYSYYESTDTPKPKDPVINCLKSEKKDGVQMAYVEYDDSGRIKTVTDPDLNKMYYYYEDVFVDDSDSSKPAKIIGNLRRCTVDSKNHETII
ncbi:MAG: kelch repeat-containing protein, partial [Bacillota bacterium]|nr:kelch repeat-containing protein [Bacillota bacterium]